MTTNPDDLLTCRAYLQPRTGLPAISLGIKGDDAHAADGGYHIGNDGLAAVGRLNTDYSKRESARDRPGTNDASAFDIGAFDVVHAGRRVTLRSLSSAIVTACRAGDPRARDIREVIWTPDGTSVTRWDRLGIRSTGSSSHRSHTHLSFFRDSVGRRSRDDNFLGLLKSIFEGEDTVLLTPDDIKEITRNVTCAVTRGAWRDGHTASTFGEGYGPGPDLQTVMNELAVIRTAVGAPAQVVMTDAQVETIATRVSTAIVASGSNLLTDADLPALRTEMIGAVKDAFRQGTDS